VCLSCTVKHEPKGLCVGQSGSFICPYLSRRTCSKNGRETGGVDPCTTRRTIVVVRKGQNWRRVAMGPLAIHWLLSEGATKPGAHKLCTENTDGSRIVELALARTEPQRRHIDMAIEGTSHFVEISPRSCHQGRMQLSQSA
jgi:hypothetical protein